MKARGFAVPNAADKVAEAAAATPSEVVLAWFFQPARYHRADRQRHRA